jgi:hypothetical protein
VSRSRCSPAVPDSCSCAPIRAVPERRSSAAVGDSLVGVAWLGGSGEWEEREGEWEEWEEREGEWEEWVRGKAEAWRRKERREEVEEVEEGRKEKGTRVRQQSRAEYTGGRHSTHDKGRGTIARRRDRSSVLDNGGRSEGVDVELGL